MSSTSAQGPAASTRPTLSGYPNRRARIAGTVFTGVWLLYPIGAVADLFPRHHRYGGVYIGVGVAIIVVFCALYLILVPNWPSLSEKYRLPGLGALALLAVAACVAYGQLGVAGLWIFVSSASGLLVRARGVAVRAVLASIACYLFFGWTTHLDSGNFLNNLLLVTFVGFGMIGLRRQFELTAELSRAREEVAQLAANEERLRLARDMHDLTGQSLSTITLKSELAARLLGRMPASADRDRVRDEVEQVAAVSRQTLRDIREAISGYRRPTLAVEIIAARAALASAGIAVHDDAELTLLSGTFDADAEAALAWSVREAVTNVVRHSGAYNCHISITRHGTALSLEVRDDGRGYFKQGQPSTSQPQGSGLHGIAERLRAVGGSLELRPNATPGFCLIATVSPGRTVSPGSAASLGRAASPGEATPRNPPSARGGVEPAARRESDAAFGVGSEAGGDGGGPRIPGLAR
jgi:two-component system sensor histidine kinase DesK